MARPSQDAIDTFEAALAIDPGNTDVYLELGEAARNQGLQGKAIHYYREALKREPNNFAALSGEFAGLNSVSVAPRPLFLVEG